VIRSLYRGATWLAAPLLRRHLARRLPQGKEEAERLGERYGKASLARPAGRLAWLHGASVGETQSLLPLIEALAARESGLSFLVTTGTVTSARLLARRPPPRTLHQYLPLDRQAWIVRFLDHWRPDFALWVESEFWPNLLGEARRRGIPMGLVNGRLSARSQSRWRLAGALIRPLLKGFTVVLAQDPIQAERLAALGAKDASCLGNLKFAAAPLPAEPAALGDLTSALAGRETWLAASTHSGEEAIIAAAHRAIEPRHPRLLTIIAPRHVERAPAIAAELTAAGFRVVLRSEGEPVTAATQIYLADTMGELGLFYRLVPLAFVAGSYRWQGHNPIEPALLGAAVLSGPRVANFQDIFDRMAAAGAVSFATEADLPAAVERLLAEPKEAGARARAFAEAERAGILERILDALAPVTEPHRTGRPDA
jgi:3-deoxy-D-manno-octulosonic-acid transferase